jgi:hypothetical protein
MQAYSATEGIAGFVMVAYAERARNAPNASTKMPIAVIMPNQGYYAILSKLHTRHQSDITMEEWTKYD